MRAQPSNSTKLETRSGWAAAKYIEKIAPANQPTTAARSIPAASITIRRSSAHPSSVGIASVVVLDAPQPLESNSTTRLNAASRCRNRARQLPHQVDRELPPSRKEQIKRPLTRDLISERKIAVPHVPRRRSVEHRPKSRSSRRRLRTTERDAPSLYIR
jgi:hypothetical protein